MFLTPLAWTPIPGEGPSGKGPWVGSGRSSEPAEGAERTGEKSGQKGTYRAGPRAMGRTATSAYRRKKNGGVRGARGRHQTEDHGSPAQPCDSSKRVALLIGSFSSALARKMRASLSSRLDNNKRQVPTFPDWL